MELIWRENTKINKSIVKTDHHLEILHVNSGRKDEWNRLTESTPQFNLLQSFEWGEFKKDLGLRVHRVALYQDKQFTSGAQVLYYPILNGLFSIGYIPRGPLCSPNEKPALSQLFRAIHKLSKQERAIFLKIEPQWDNNEYNQRIPQNFGFQFSDHRNQPQASILIDISVDLESIMGQMKKSTRKNINVAKRHGVIVRSGSKKDINSFYEMLVTTSKRSNFSIRDFDYYEKEWEKFSEINQVKLLFAEYKNQVIASRMVFKFGSHAAQFHSASSGEFNNVKANDLLVWEAIRWAKSQKCITYDLWGIPDEIAEIQYKGEVIPKHWEGGLWGIYNFKRGFGGKVICYIGAYDYAYSNLFYKLFVKGVFRRASIEEVISQFTR